MTAKEALRLSKTGFIWDKHGYPYHILLDLVIDFQGNERGNAESPGFHPQPPYLREEKEQEVKESVIVLKNCDTERPKHARNVLVFSRSRSFLGGGWNHYKDGWVFHFPAREHYKISDLFWCDIPKVVLPEGE